MQKVKSRFPVILVQYGPITVFIKKNKHKQIEKATLT